MNWADELIPQYKEGLSDLESISGNLTDSLEDRVDSTQINSMIDSVGFSIEWMETGRQPGTYRGVDKRDVYRPKQYDEMDIIPDITEQLEKEREPLYMSQKQKQVFMDVIKKFSNRERECFIMHTAEQLSMSEIAERLNLKKRTVQQYIERAREKVNTISA